jgi:hypothetical protein
MALGPPVRAIGLLALSYVCRQIYLEVQGLVFAQNKFIGYPVPLAALFKRMASYQANQIRVVTVNVLAAFTVMEDNRTVASSRRWWRRRSRDMGGQTCRSRCRCWV